MKILKSVVPETARDGEGLLVVDDLADTGATVKIAHAILPKAHVATVYAKGCGGPSSIPSLPRFRKAPGSISRGTSA